MHHAAMDTASLPPAMQKIIERQKQQRAAVEADRLVMPTKEGGKTAQLREYLHRRIAVEIADGRRFEGRFMSFDKQKNIVLIECTEIRKTQPVTHPLEESLLSKERNKPEDEELLNLIDAKRRGEFRRPFMGCVLIPGKHIQKVFLDLNSKDDLMAEQNGLGGDEFSVPVIAADTPADNKSNSNQSTVLGTPSK